MLCEATPPSVMRLGEREATILILEGRLSPIGPVEALSPSPDGVCQSSPPEGRAGARRASRSRRSRWPALRPGRRRSRKERSVGVDGGLKRSEQRPAPLTWFVDEEAGRGRSLVRSGAFSWPRGARWRWSSSGRRGRGGRGRGAPRSGWSWRPARRCGAWQGAR